MDKQKHIPLETFGQNKTTANSRFSQLLRQFASLECKFGSKFTFAFRKTFLSLLEKSFTLDENPPIGLTLITFLMINMGNGKKMASEIFLNFCHINRLYLSFGKNLLHMNLKETTATSFLKNQQY